MKRLAAVAVMMMLAGVANADCPHNSANQAWCPHQHIQSQYKDSWFRIYNSNFRTVEQWTSENPWAAEGKWAAVNDGSTTISSNMGWGTPYSKPMVYRDRITGAKRCLDTNEAKQMKYKSTDAIRPCDTW